MKRIERFSCEHCGGVFDTEEKAIACELHHAHPIGVTKNHFVCQWTFPRYVDIEMSDGSIERYEFCKQLGKAISEEESK